MKKRNKVILIGTTLLSVGGRTRCAATDLFQLHGGFSRQL